MLTFLACVMEETQIDVSLTHNITATSKYLRAVGSNVSQGPRHFFHPMLCLGAIQQDDWAKQPGIGNGIDWESYLIWESLQPGGYSSRHPQYIQ